MGGKPSKSDYQASTSEKTSASIAYKEWEDHKTTYEPIYLAMRDASKSTGPSTILRRRASADVFQAFDTGGQGDAMMQQADTVSSGSDMAQAYQGQQGLASASALGIQNKEQANVLGIARGQAADAQMGLAQASRLATSEALTRAKAKQDTKMAQLSAAGQIAGAAIGARDDQGKNLLFGDTKLGAFSNRFSDALARQS